MHYDTLSCYTIRLLFSQLTFTRFISCSDISCSSRHRSGSCSRAKAVMPYVSFHRVAPPVTPSSGLLFINNFSTSRPSLFSKPPFCTSCLSFLSKSTSISEAPCISMAFCIRVSLLYSPLVRSDTADTVVCVSSS